MKICIGIISWLPSENEHRIQRIERFNKTLDELDNAFGDRVGYLIVSQNWRDYKLPKKIKDKAEVFNYDKLGILKARKTLRKHFLESDYDYLIMSDDDVMMKYNDSSVIDNYLKALNDNPQGFMFLQYGWSLNLCAISRWIYEREDMVDVDPEKNEGYEDTTFPNLLHYKYPDKEFKVQGIEFLQHKLENRRKLKSTWENVNIKHILLKKRSQYIINGFKNGNFDVKKLKDEALEKVTDESWMTRTRNQVVVKDSTAFTGLPDEWWKEDF